jgi:hypothetical protein
MNIHFKFVPTDFSFRHAMVRDSDKRLLGSNDGETWTESPYAAEWSATENAFVVHAAR